MSGWIPDTVIEWIRLNSSISVEWANQYTNGFKYFRIQKSTGVKSGDRGVHLILQPRLITWSLPNVFIRNFFTGELVWGGALFGMNFNVEIKPLAPNAHTTFSWKRLKHNSEISMQVLQPDFGQFSSQKKGATTKEAVKFYWIVTEWSGFVVYSRGFDVTQIQLLRILLQVCKYWN